MNNKRWMELTYETTTDLKRREEELVGEEELENTENQHEHELEAIGRHLQRNQ